MNASLLDIHPKPLTSGGVPDTPLLPISAPGLHRSFGCGCFCKTLEKRIGEG